MTDEQNDRAYFFAKRPGTTIVSKGFSDFLGQKLRIASRIFEGDEGLCLAHVKDEVVLRRTPKARFEVKAVFLEDDRSIKTLTIQRYSSTKGPHERDHFSFVGQEIQDLLRFLIAIGAAEITDGRKFRLSDEEVKELVLDHAQLRRAFAGNEALFRMVAESEELKRDLVALGYRRKQLEHFRCLLEDSQYFENERRQLSTTPEGVWQMFFEQNHWIFGYGLSYQFLTSLTDRKLEQIVRGYDVTGGGKRADALMKTQGIINSLCFVEIKRHDTALLTANPYRSGTWAPSKELSGGVAQVQTTVQEAVEQIGRKLTSVDELGDPTGETSFNVAPRSFLVIGSSAEFLTERGVNETKVRSFELFRRNTHRPEVLTFDELLARAKFIVEQTDNEFGLK